MNENEMEEMKHVQDTLVIESALQKAEIKQLTFLVFELIHQLEQKDEKSTDLKIQYAKALMVEKTAQLDELDISPNNSRLVFRKYDIHEYYSQLIQKLEN